MYEMKEVYYKCYCHQCKYWKLGEHCEPCNTCLTQFMNYFSHKPTEYVPKEGTDNVRQRDCRSDAIVTE